MWSIPAFLFFFAFLHRVAPGVIVKEIMQAFNASGEIIGLLSAMYFYAYAGFMIPAGLLIVGTWLVSDSGLVAAALTTANIVNIRGRRHAGILPV